MVNPLPELKTRDEIQRYIVGVAEEMGVTIASDQLATELDRRDGLADYRDKFEIPTIGQLLDEDERAKDEDLDISQKCLYFCGNSLGLQPKNSLGLLQVEMAKWANKGVRGHTVGEFPWFTIEDSLAEESANIIGCKLSEVTYMNSLTANIHFAMVAFYRPKKDKYKILIEDKCFPSDLVAVQSQIRLHGYDPATALVKVPPRDGEMCWRTEDIIKAIESNGESLALVFFSGVHYATGHLFDMKAITKAAHRKGVYAGFDLAHVVGNVELHLHEWEVDFAVWCSYKYLNSGPGGIAGFYVHERHGNDPNLPRLLGWWSHSRCSRFLEEPKQDLVLGAKGFHVSNPPIMQCMLLKASLNVFSTTSMTQLCLKSRLLTGYLELLIEENLLNDKVQPHSAGRYVTIVTSNDPSQRGCQLSLQFSWPVEEVYQYLTQRGVVCDLRESKFMRVAPVPLYNSFSDVQRFYTLLKQAIDNKN